MDDIEMDQVIQEFIIESRENLDRLDADFIELESNPTSREVLAGIFRAVHTVKGTSGFLGLGHLERVAHQGENLLSLLRDGLLGLTPDMTTALLHMVDAIREMLDAVEADGTDGTNEYRDLVKVLAALAAPPQKVHPALLKPVLDSSPADDVQFELGQIVEDALTVAQAVSEPRAQALTPDVSDSSESRRSNSADPNIRVDVALLDQLVNLVGELVLTRNQILQFNNKISDSTFLNTTQRLNLITSELQEGVMRTRMQPIGNVWGRFPRIVRDLAVACGKQVRIEMEGKDTELDKTILEAIKDPLTHIVRNSVDHGIETPEVRSHRGKSVEGVLLLRAYHEGGQVNIEMIDDGGGIDPDRVRAKSIEKGLLTAEQAARLTDQEAIKLIFMPGFSTAETITNISGRGVGMDVVRSNIEKIGGTVDAQSQLGVGTTLKIKIPLTLAIVPALIVVANGDRFAIPQVSLLELVRLADRQLGQIETIGATKVFRLRGKLLPIVALRDVLGLPSEPVSVDEAVNIVVLQAEGRQFGLLVDGINDTEEIVVKPLSPLLKGVSALAGTTIMGDGDVALILDVLGIAHSAHVVGGRAEGHSAIDARSDEADGRAQSQSLLVCTVGGQRVAMPLDRVSRLEEFGRDALESAAGQDVVQYRGQLLPVLCLAKELGLLAPPADNETPIRVLVFSAEDRSIGFIVDEIIDILGDDITTTGPSNRRGVFYSAVVGGCVTDMLDLDALVGRAAPRSAGMTEGSHPLPNSSRPLEVG